MPENPQLVSYNVDGPVAVIRLERPDKLNAVTFTMINDIRAPRLNRRRCFVPGEALAPVRPNRQPTGAHRMTQATILHGVNDGVATTLTLDRPDRRNAMTNQMVREVYEILLDAAGDMSSPWLLSRLWAPPRRDRAARGHER